ncbi:TolC family protein [Chitinivorax sp. B]|uniref:TolC family protein n=1 Tax=Chitinivorax sp. B TaxID=2502235 RepID=UPI0010F69230|nr:TolC family protein [Chitinivorax sp. B]
MFSRSIWPILCGLAGLAHAEPLTFQAALGLAEQQSPALAARYARIRAMQSQVISADALPDPKLIVGIDNLPISGADAWRLNRDFMTMQKIGVMQEVPNADKRRARAAMATADVALTLAESRVEQQKVRIATARAWLTRYYLEQRQALFTELRQENTLLTEAVHTQIAAGRGGIADAVAPQLEAAQLADQAELLQRDVAKATAELRRWLGTAADESLAGTPPVLPIDPLHFRQQLHAHPDLQVFEPARQKALAEVRETRATKQSDWGVEFAYQRRGPQFGDMISLQVSFDLPLFSKTRQDPRIAAKAQQVTQLDGEREAMLRSHRTDLDNDLADYASVNRQLVRAQQTFLPLAQQKVDLQLASYRAGKAELSNVLTARRELTEQRMKVIELILQQQLVASKLYFSYGEGAP